MVIIVLTGFMLYLESYPYTEDLIKLDSCRPKSRKGSVDERLSGIFTPLDLQRWESMLENHPDRRYVNFILSGIKDGFRVGYHRPSECKPALSSARKNMKSAEDNPQVVRDYLDSELRRGVVLGPFLRQEVSEVHISRFGVIPKSSQPGSGG